MLGRSMRRLISCIAVFVVSSTAFASAPQFYVFPVLTVEGLLASDKPRALIAPQFSELFSGAEGEALARETAHKFEGLISQAFSGSVVSGMQVDYAVKGNYAFSPASESQCSSGFRAPIRSSYAVIPGITRASLYKVERGEVLEILVPVTLSLQLVKPEKAKVVYSVSDTLYTNFKFSKEEYVQPETQALIRKKVLEGIDNQLVELVGQLKKGFQPQSAIANVIGTSGKFAVIDAGYEKGLVVGDEPSAMISSAGASSKELFFRVISARSGHSVIMPLQGKLEKGQTLELVVESAADDSAKPRLLPVIGLQQKSSIKNGVADLFTASIGFDSAFQVVPVNPYFAETVRVITAQANCIDWSKFPATSMIKESRGEAPNFFLDFEVIDSPVYLSQGVGGTKTEESFSVLLNLRLVDSKGRVHFSDSVIEPYKLEKVAGQGISILDAFEIARKNALLELVKRFKERAKLEEKTLAVTRVEEGKVYFRSDGVQIDQIGRLAFSRNLDIAIGGMPVVLPLEVGIDDDSIDEKDGEIVLNVSQITSDTPMPKKGDRVTLVGISKPGAIPVSRCEAPIYVSPNTIVSNDAPAVLVEQLISEAPKAQIVIPKRDRLIGDVNELLDAGLFKPIRFSPGSTRACFTPGYAYKLEKKACDNQLCTASFIEGVVLKLRASPDSPEQNLQSVQRTNASGVFEQNLVDYASANSFSRFAALIPSLKKKFEVEGKF